MEQGLLKQSSDDSIRYEGGAREESQGGEYDQSLVIEVPQEEQNISLRVDRAHVISDSLYSICLIGIAAIIAHFPETKTLDPIMTYFVAIAVLVFIVPIIMDCVKILKNLYSQHDIEQVKDEIAQISYV